MGGGSAAARRLVKTRRDGAEAETRQWRRARAAREWALLSGSVEAQQLVVAVGGEVGWAAAATAEVVSAREGVAAATVQRV